MWDLKTKLVNITEKETKDGNRDMAVRVKMERTGWI